MIGLPRCLVTSASAVWPVALGIVLSTTGSLAQQTGGDVLVERHAYLMGTRVHLATHAESRASALLELEQMLDVLESTEAELSTWSETSLLGRLNRHPVGEAFVAPPWLCELLTELEHWHRETNGAFDPAIGALVEAWALRRNGRVPSSAELESARTRAGLSRFSVTPAPCAVTRRADATLDAGAFGKGWALDRLVAGDFGADGDWLADLGGQVAVGQSSQGRHVALAHPAHRDRPVAHIRLHHGSLAVSGGSERDHVVDDMTVGHILDPRTGRPVHRTSSVAVWHARALVADILATALYVMGVEEGLAWAEAHGIAACFLVPTPSSQSSADRPGVELSATAAFSRRFF